MYHPIHRGALAITIFFTLLGCAANMAIRNDGSRTTVTPAAHRVILFVWDGMRPDSISETDTPHLAALAKRGSYFADNHSSYPTFTMMNAAAFATGAFSGDSGFFGNSLYRPGAPARNSGGESVDLNDPVFTEDYGILKQLDANQDEHLFLVGTLFLVLVVMHLSWELSRLEDRTKILAEEVALLRTEVHGHMSAEDRRTA